VAGIGVVLSLLLTNTSFSMQAYLGVIMLAGIVVSNAILLVDYINTLRRRDGLPLREAVELGGRTRLRPILMTSIATMLGLVPMAIGFGDGRRAAGAARARGIGGLLASTVVTLVLVPAIYTLFEEGWRSRKTAGSCLNRFPGHRVTPLAGNFREWIEHKASLAKSGMGTMSPSSSMTRSHTESDRGRGACRARCGRSRRSAVRCRAGCRGARARRARCGRPLPRSESAAAHRRRQREGCRENVETRRS
jgi:hypothetical protein